MARNGYDVTIAARSSDTIAGIAEEARAAGSDARALALDLSDLDGLDEVISALNDERPISLLSYNASLHTTSLLEADPEMLRRTTDINALAPVVAVQAALPGLRQSQGLVMLTGGKVALRPSAPYGVLSVGKAAMRAAGFALAEELEPLGVRLRMFTIDGLIRPGSNRFGPDLLASTFWAFANNPESPVEQIYAGRP